MNNKKLLVKKLRVVKEGNWRDAIDFERADDYMPHPSGNTFYYMKTYDSYTPHVVTKERMMQTVVQYKEAGYKVILMEQ
jgi:hypothetical protein